MQTDYLNTGRIDMPERSDYTMASAFAVVLSRYAFHLNEEDYRTVCAYEAVLGASLVHYLGINSGACQITMVTYPKGSDFAATVAFDLIGDRNSHIGRLAVAKSLNDYLEQARTHVADKDRDERGLLPSHPDYTQVTA